MHQMAMPLDNSFTQR